MAFLLDEEEYRPALREEVGHVLAGREHVSWEIDREGGDVQHVKVIKDIDEDVPTSEKISQRWKEYFEDLLNTEDAGERRLEEVVGLNQEVQCTSSEKVR
ncbi:hypothetical protein O3P69_019758 [Scylla paramamosain]|uniref:Uncharacterized protein n=1 Tax=Scylla paramamosain TaxID=85552 RepID=A0AAW0SYV6_SCYPA